MRLELRRCQEEWLLLESDRVVGRFEDQRLALEVARMRLKAASAGASFRLDYGGGRGEPSAEIEAREQDQTPGDR